MTEFLNETSRIAYPLARAWPSTFDADDRWTRVLLDASVGTDAILPSGTFVTLRSVRRRAASSGVSAAIVFTFGTSASDAVDVPVVAGLGRRATVYANAAATASSSAWKVLLTVDGTVATSLSADASISTSAITVGVPLALRCVSAAIRRVTAVSAYTPTECQRPVFKDAERTATKTITGVGTDLTLVAKDGLDLETVEIATTGETVLRVSAITAPAETTAADDVIDIMVRGDACFGVETLPGVKVAEGGGLVERTASDTNGILGGGVIRISNACKPCCQCEDYKSAFDAVKTGDDAAKEIKDLLDDAKARYEAAVLSYNAAKVDIEASVDSYANIHATATAVASGGLYAGSNATGLRKRVAVTLMVENMTRKPAEVTVSDFTTKKAGAGGEGQRLSTSGTPVVYGSGGGGGGGGGITAAAGGTNGGAGGGYSGAAGTGAGGGGGNIGGSGGSGGSGVAVIVLRDTGVGSAPTPSFSVQYQDDRIMASVGVSAISVHSFGNGIYAYTFKNTVQCQVLFKHRLQTLALLLVGGGGGGGAALGGGGGGGEVKPITSAISYHPAGTLMTVEAGSGGAGSQYANTPGGNGGTTRVTIAGSTYIAIGGGGGVSFSSGPTSASVACGGGGAGSLMTPGVRGTRRSGGNPARCGGDNGYAPGGGGGAMSDGCCGRGMDLGSFVRAYWRTAGSVSANGNSMPSGAILLRPGDTLTVVATYAWVGTTNDATHPTGGGVGGTVTIQDATHDYAAQVT